MLIVTKDRELSATLDGRRIQPKVALLFALMAVRRERAGVDAAWVSALELGSCATWCASRPESIGKEVSKALKALGPTATAAVESPRLGKTRSWRLRPEFTEIQLHPDLGTVERALDCEQLGETPDEFLSWLSPAVRALTDLHGGRALAAVEHARAAFDKAASRNPMVHASTAVLLGRAASRAGCVGDPADASGARSSEETMSAIPDSQDLLRTLFLHPLWNALGQHHSLRARISARLDFSLRHDPDRLIADAPGGISINLERAFALAHQAAPMAAAGDLGTAGMLFNVAGALANLSGDYHHARVWLLRAMPLLIATGALAELESAVFNLALNLDYSYRASKNEADAQLAGAMLELDELLCSAFGLDRETIQTQALLASLAIRQGDLDRAGRALDRAEQALAGIVNQGEHGCYHERRAQLMAARIVDGSRKKPAKHARPLSGNLPRPDGISRTTDGTCPPDLEGRLLSCFENAIRCYEADQRLSEAGSLRKLLSRARRAGSPQALLRVVRDFCESM